MLRKIHFLLVDLIDHILVLVKDALDDRNGSSVMTELIGLFDKGQRTRAMRFIIPVRRLEHFLWAWFLILKKESGCGSANANDFSSFALPLYSLEQIRQLDIIAHPKDDQMVIHQK